MQRRASHCHETRKLQGARGSGALGGSAQVGEAFPTIARGRRVSLKTGPSRCRYMRTATVPSTVSVAKSPRANVSRSSALPARARLRCCACGSRARPSSGSLSVLDEDPWRLHGFALRREEPHRHGHRRPPIRRGSAWLPRCCRTAGPMAGLEGIRVIVLSNEIVRARGKGWRAWKSPTSCSSAATSFPAGQLQRRSGARSLPAARPDSHESRYRRSIGTFRPCRWRTQPRGKTRG